MRSDGNGMIVGIKDTAKLIGIMIIVCCAVFVCTLFLNYNIDIAAIRDKVVTENAMLYYQAQKAFEIWKQISFSEETSERMKAQFLKWAEDYFHV